MEAPYFPHIIKGVVERADDAFQKKTEKAFSHVHFDYGTEAQVHTNLLKTPTLFPLVWLFMPFTEIRGDFNVFANISFSLSIIYPTKYEYTQPERDNNITFPILIPIYDEVMLQISKEKLFVIKNLNSIKHKRIIRPFWGAGETVDKNVNKNLFNQYVDALLISDIELMTKFKSNC